MRRPTATLKTVADWQRRILALSLAAWIALGTAHVAIVMLRSDGWRPDRSAPGAAAVLGHPDETDPRRVAGPLSLASQADTTWDRLLLLLPLQTDSAHLLYTRYQLAHLLYPRRVAVRRLTADIEAPAAVPAATLLIAAPGVEVPSGCRETAESLGHRLVDCQGS